MNKKIRENSIKVLLIILGVILFIIGVILNNTVSVKSEKSLDAQIVSINTKEGRSTSNMETGKVIAKYVDTNGNKISDDDIYSDYLGEEYNIQRKQINGYTEYGVDPINKTGNYMKEDIEVVFVYQNATNIVNVNNENKKVTVQILNEKKLSKYNFKIITKSESGNILTNAGYKIIDGAGNVVKDGVSQGQSFVVGTLTIGDLGTDIYNIEQTNFPDRYEAFINSNIIIKMIKTLNNETNLYQVDIEYDNIDGLKAYVQNDDIIIEIQNKEKQYGKLIKKYHDKNGKEINEDEILEGEIGKEYSLEEKGKEIKGYTFKEIEGDIKGKYKKEDIIVTYIYEKNIEYGRVIKKYKDENGKTIHKQEIEIGEIGKEYSLGEKGKEIKGYTFKEVEGDIKGKYTKEDIVVKYIYESNSKVFDLEIQKSIKKIIIKDNKSTTTRKVSDKQGIVKIEVPSKMIKNTTLQIEYEILVKNVGQVAGYAKKITDYIPKDFKYIGENGNKVSGSEVTSDELADVLLKPGDSKKLLFTFEWKLNEKNLGERTNKAQITLYYNDENLKDKNSNNIDDSTLIVSIKTGAISYTFQLMGLLFVLIGIALIIIKIKRKDK